MAEVIKKTKAAAKPRKTTSKKATGVVAADPASRNHTSISDADVAQLAHSYYRERGHKHGHHIEDWFRAEQELRGKAS